ncbi:PDZ domain-containing protein [Pelagicoccus sp. SDUM812002]|uniref:PDZ domain-containing protein n=1 Tax=Pelagicoccus sp. SDUM812002 TaxID=3041266 RepID=UPI00280DC6A0|nr:PDZ domain-containing protein [Pelagicoccus sp. SDUM812002]MDQ8187906.1 PDZ domain-containing protein [Pelagicoccus sp. SDUM812002]
MNSYYCKSFLTLLFVVLSTIPFSGAQDDEVEDPEYYTELDPITIDGQSVEDAGFAFIAKFRKKMPWAGIKTLVVTKVGEDSPAAKAGIQKGDKIIKIRNSEIEGIKIKDLQYLLQEQSEDGSIPLTIIPKKSDVPKNVILEFTFEKTKRQKKAGQKSSAYPSMSTE